MPEERQDRCRRYAGDPRCRAQAGRPCGAQKLLNLSREAPDLAVVQARRQHQGLILAEGPTVGLLSSQISLIAPFNLHFPGDRRLEGRKLRDRKSTRLNYSHYCASRMPSSACKKIYHKYSILYIILIY